MTARMLLSLFLDFFRCRRPFWRRATISLPDAVSTWSLSQIMDAPQKALELPATASVSSSAKEEPTGISSDSDYDSAGNLEASDDCKINIISVSNEIKTNHIDDDGDGDGDKDDDGFDDPRLPELII